MKLRVALTVLMAGVGLSAPAMAKPTLWDVAKDPRRARAHQTLVAVERMLMRADQSPFDPSMQRNFMRAALAMLELSGGEALPDSRLAFLLGDVLTDAAVRRDEEARQLLRAALKRDPDSPLAGRAWFNVAIASARLGDPTSERDAYTRALDHVWERDFRANIFMNRGESKMVLGDLRGAIADYRSAIGLAERPELTALAHYGLGIALERSGDLPSALEAIRIADAIRVPLVGSALDLPSVFFVPAYDLHYYKALSAMAAERRAKTPGHRAAFLREAIERWDRYLTQAVPDGHRWVQNAKLHRAACERRLKTALQDAEGRERKPVRGDGLERLLD